MRRLVIALVVFAAVLAASPARAQGFFSPFYGYTYGNDAGNCSSFFSDCEEKRGSYGATFGKYGVIGFEQDISWTPEFFGKGADLDDNRVFTAMSSLMVSIPIGPLRPYGLYGIGLIKTKVQFTAAEIADFGDTSFGYNYGLGVSLLLPAHLGIRADWRRLRTFGGLEILGIEREEAKLQFSRFSFGLVLH